MDSITESKLWWLAIFLEWCLCMCTLKFYFYKEFCATKTLLFQTLPIIFLLLEPLRSPEIRLCTCFSWQSHSHSHHSHHGHRSRRSCQSCSHHGRWAAAVADAVSVAAHGDTVIASICAAGMQQALRNKSFFTIGYPNRKTRRIKKLTKYRIEFYYFKFIIISLMI